MNLRAWRSPLRAVDFEPETGRARFFKSGRTELATALPGFAGVEKPLLGKPGAFAVYRTADGLFFSAGARRWALRDPDLSFRHSHPFPLCRGFRSASEALLCSRSRILTWGDCCWRW